MTFPLPCKESTRRISNRSLQFPVTVSQQKDLLHHKDLSAHHAYGGPQWPRPLSNHPPSAQYSHTPSISARHLPTTSHSTVQYRYYIRHLLSFDLPASRLDFRQGAASGSTVMIMGLADFLEKKVAAAVARLPLPTGIIT